MLMKKILFLLLMALPVTQVFSQDKHAVSKNHQKIANHKSQIHSVVKNEKTVEFTISSTKPFYVGGNIHVLHIGDKEFRLSKQTKGKLNTITFFIPESDFNALTEGANVYMVYGQPFKKQPTDQEIELYSTQFPNSFWSFGKFTKSLLKK